MGNLTGEALGKAFPCKEQDLSSALEDAGYALRRFEETTAHIDFSEWPKEMQSATSEALRQAHEQAADGRRILAKFDGSGKTVSSVDLLDITLDLGSVEMELSALETGTSEVLCLGTLDMAQMAKAHAFADELIQADQSAAAAQTKVYGALRERLGRLP
jgi:type II secretory pathway predicted ATPase ExeA